MNRFIPTLFLLVLVPVFCATAFAASGDPDPTFGSGGAILTGGFAGGGLPIARATAIQADGRIVAAGQGGTGFALARYLDDGSSIRTSATAAEWSRRFPKAEASTRSRSSPTTGSSPQGMR